VRRAIFSRRTGQSLEVRLVLIFAICFLSVCVSVVKEYLFSEKERAV